MTKDGSFLTNVGGSEGRVKSIQKPTCNKQHHVINSNRQQQQLLVTSEKTFSVENSKNIQLKLIILFNIIK